MRKREDRHAITKTEPMQAKVASAEAVRDLLHEIQCKLTEQLDKSITRIASQKTPYLKDKANYDRSLSKLSKLHHEKQETQKKLHQIEIQEKLCKAEINKSYATLSPQQVKSSFRREGQQQLRQIQKRHREKQQQRQRKAQQLQNKSRMHQEQQQKLKQTQHQEQVHRKRLEIQQRLQDLKLKRQQKKNKLNEEQKLISQLKSRKKLFEDYLNKWESLESEQIEDKRRMYEQRVKQRSIDLSSIKDHEKKYEEMMRKRKEEVSRKRMEVSRIGATVCTHKHFTSKAHRIAVEEENQHKREEEQRQSAKRYQPEKRKQYDGMVKNCYAPKAKRVADNSEQSINPVRTIKRSALEPNEAKLKGLQFLEINKQKADRQRDRSFNSSSIETTDPQRSKYIDYLSKTRMKRSKSQTKRTDNLFARELKRANTIMKSESLTEKEKFEELKLLTEKMEEKDPNNNNSSILLQKVTAKISLLQSIN